MLICNKILLEKVNATEYSLNLENQNHLHQYSMKIKWSLYFYLLIFAGCAMQSQEKKWTLDECVRYALQNNITIKQTELDSELAQIDKKGAFGSFLPRVGANASHSWNIGLNQNITTGLLENQTTQFTAAGVNIGLNLYKGLQNQNELRRSNLSILAAQYQLSKIKDDVSLNVANAFLQILFNKENLKVQKEQLSLNGLQLERTTALVEAGSVARADLLDMEATVAGTQQNVIAAENALLISRLSLAQLLQLDDFKNFDIADRDYQATESEIMVQTPEAIIAKAKEVRMEVKIAKTNQEIAEKDVQIAKGGLQPTVQAFYALNTRAAYADRVVGIDANGAPIYESPLGIIDQFDQNKGHSFGLQLDIPILNGFAARNNVARAKVGLERSKIALSQEELNLERNVYTAYTDAQGALNALEAAKVALAARAGAFEFAKEKYEVGLMNALDYNQAQTLYVNSQSDLLRTKYDYIFKIKLVELYFGIPITKI